MEHVILGFLTMGDMTGYDIKRLMSISTSFFYDASYGSIYPALRKLEERGLVKSSEAIESGRLRKVYSITDEGREEFLRWLGGP
ncbi:MAG: PadR family transcriptional regulator, partial [Clostridia bacterium]|nr:PadR family transcriptional regulator [Clostridia bacterium]